MNTHFCYTLLPKLIKINHLPQQSKIFITDIKFYCDKKETTASVSRM